MSNNLELWNAVEKTNPAHVKAITGKSYQGTSPKPYYLIHKATETFGPIGLGWGFHIVDERIEEGAGGEKMSIARVRVWYEWNGKRGEVEHVGGTSFSGTRSSGKPFTDEDAPKKSVTDAMVKALSMIGFAGDIFIGRYDDSKYVNEMRQEFAEEPVKSQQRKPVAAESNNPAPEQPSLYKRLSVANSACADKAAFNNLWGAPATIKAQSQVSPEEHTKLEDEKKAKFAELEKKEPSDYVRPSFDDLPESTQQAVKNLGA